MTCPNDLKVEVVENVYNLEVVIQDGCEQLVVSVLDPLVQNSGGSSGVTYNQDFPPPSALHSETWYNPLTQQLKVYTDGEWKPTAPDGGYF